MDADGGSQIQIENGSYTRLHNEIMERLAKTDLNGYEFRCLMYLLRKSYGFQKKDAQISLDEWEAGTQLDRRNLSKTLKSLVKRQIVRKEASGTGRGHVTTWAFNKYFELWDSELKGVNNAPFNNEERVSNRVDKGCQIVQERVSNRVVNTRDLKKVKKVKKAASDDDAENSLSPQAFVKLVQQDGFMYMDKDAHTVAARLIANHGWAACIAALEKTTERHRAKIKKGERGIMAPVAYIASMLADPSFAATAQNNSQSAWAQLPDIPDYMKG